ncbi:MAG: hypothetical protein D6752_04630, partial [Candidatus Nitrosothermus koennekii]
TMVRDINDTKVTLTDQFYKKGIQVKVTNQEKLCTPALKFKEKPEKEPDIPDDPHYTVYKIEGGGFGVKIEYKDQFRKLFRPIVLGNAIMLFTWADKSQQQQQPPPAIREEHLTCYEAKTNTAIGKWWLFDQFGNETVGKFTLELFCLPAQKNGNGNMNIPHLACYRIESNVDAKQVFIWDQFIREQNKTPIKVNPGIADLFCQEALKKPSPVGGELLPINTTALFIYTISANVYWILPMVGGIGGAAIIIKRIRSRNSHN